MLVLNKEDIKKVYTMEDAVKAAEEAVKTDAETPLRINFDMPEKNGQALYMPGYLKGQGITGIKIVSVFPDNSEKGVPVVPAQVLLLDPETGETAAIIDGTYLTQVRTGAIQGYATKVLSREDSKTALVIGTGGQFLSQSEAMLTVRDLETLYIFDINLEKAEAAAEKAREEFKRFDTEIKAVSSLDDIYDELDIITTVTTSKQYTFDGEKVKDGIHVNGVGAYTPEMMEIPPEYFKRTEELFMDNADGVLNEAGDVMRAIESGAIEKDSCFEIREIAEGKKKGRTDDKQNTVFKTVGAAVLDIVTAWDIYQKALEENVGTEVDI